MCSTAFVTLGQAQLRSLGCASTPIAVVPHPFGLRTRDEIRALAERCTADIVRHALGANAPTNEHPKTNDTPPPAAHLSLPGDIVTFNEQCLNNGWSDGLPLIPPTPERVRAMLSASRRSPTEIVAQLAPGFGAASIERIAINAVMAGCRPEYLRLVIAAVEAVADPSFNLQGIQATTNSATPWIIVSGPLARELGFNATMNCLGQGNWANATLGRALRLILQNIGGAAPGDMDRATHGQPGKYSFCCAENEAQSPWPALHCERGYASEQSAVTVVGASGTVNMNSHAKDAPDLLRALADSLAFPTSNDYHFDGEPWIVLSPEHAEVCQRAGLSKADVKAELWAQSKMSASRFAAKDYQRADHTRGAELGAFTPETLVPISRRPDDIGIVVAGGPGTHSVYVPTFGQTRAVTRPVKF